MKITIDGMEEIELKPRSTEILKHLLNDQDDIEKVAFGSWSCNFAGRKVTPELTRSSRSSEIPAPGVKVK